MLKISEKALELLRVKLDLTSDEQKIIKDELITDSEIQSTFIKIKKDTESEKTILSDILSSFVAINASFDSIIKLLGGTQAITTVGLEDPVKPDAFLFEDKSKPDSEKKGGGLLGTLLGLGAFAFSPAIIKFLTEDPEKIGESLNAAFTWLKEDLPNFFKNDFIPFIKQFLDTEIIGNITGMDILKSAGIATALYAGKGVILNLLTKALFKSTGWFLKSFLGFLVSPAGLAVLVAAGFVSALMYGIKKIGEYGDEKREKEAQEKWDAERAAEAAPYVEANNITKEVMDAAPDYVREKGSSVRGVIAGKVQKILKSKDAEMFKKLSPTDKWKTVEKSLTVDEKRSLMGKDKSLRDQLDDPSYKSETPNLDAKVAQMFPDTTMVMQDDYKTQLLGTPEQRKAAREALEKEGVSAESDPIIKSAKESELEAKPMPSRNPNAISIDTSKTVDGSTGGGTPSYSSYSSDEGTDAKPESKSDTGSPSAVGAPTTQAMTEAPSLAQESSNLESTAAAPEEAKPLSMDSFVNAYDKMAGTKIEEASIEATKPKPIKPPVIQNNAGMQSNRTLTVKPGQSWNINDVPDPTPILGNLFSQLFVPETSFSGAINV